MDRCPQVEVAPDEELLGGNFSLAHGARGDCALTLTASELRVQCLGGPGKSPAALRLADCLTCRAFQGSSKDTVGHYYFTVTAYPAWKRRRWGGGEGEARREVTRTFWAGGSADQEENRRTAEEWARKIAQLARPTAHPRAGGAFSVLPRPCQVLILLNPRGGKGNALSLFTTHVLPMLSKADFGFNLIVTERANHARELAREECLDRWDALAVMSGDGLMYEVVNGLMERPDWSSAIKKPLAILPAGSGNALAASVNHYSGNEHAMNPELLTTCAFILCKGLVSPMDLVSIKTGSGKRIFSFLSVAWGFVSDVDIESEKYRLLGPIRFSIGTMVRLTALRTYKGRLSYLPAGESKAPGSSTAPEEASSTLPSSGRTSPVAEANQNKFYNFCNSNNVGSGEGNGTWKGRNGIAELQDSLLVPMEEPVPQHWTVVKETAFILVLALYQSHLGADLFSAPMVTSLHDNLIHLFYITAGMPRASLLKIFLAMEKGTHMELNCPHLFHVPVKAFRIEPFGSKDIITVDGEVIECEPLQGQVHSMLGRLVCGAGNCF